METTAFEKQLAMLRPELQRLTAKFTSNREDSQDLVQETMLKALLYKTHFATGTNLKGWLFIIMRNTYINKYKREKTVKHQALPEKKADWKGSELDTERADRAIELKEIWKAICSIKPELFKPFNMHLSGYKYDEISRELNLPLGTIKSRIFLARTQIQHKLIDYFS